MVANQVIKRIIAPLVPYLAVVIGLVVFHNAWLAIAGYHAGALATMAAVKGKPSLQRITTSRKYSIVVAGALIGTAGGGLLYLILPLMDLKIDIPEYTRSVGLTSTTWPLFLGYFALLNPVIEEFYWRGFLAGDQGRLSLNDIYFSGYHLIVLYGHLSLFWLVLSFVVLTLAAWLWRRMNRLDGRLLPSIVSHMTADFAVIFAIFSMSGIRS